MPGMALGCGERDGQGHSAFARPVRQRMNLRRNLSDALHPLVVWQAAQVARLLEDGSFFGGWRGLLRPTQSACRDDRASGENSDFHTLHDTSNDKMTKEP